MARVHPELGERGAGTFHQVSVPEWFVPVVVDHVRLFLLVIDECRMEPEELIVTRPLVPPPAVVVPDYVVGTTLDLIDLAERTGARPLAPAEVTSHILNLAGLIADLRLHVDGSFPALEAFFATIGLPVDDPYAR